MRTNPTSIAVEFLASSKPSLRENALTALAAIASAEAVARLVDSTLTDSDDKVRSRGRLEILELPDEAIPFAAGRLAEHAVQREVAADALALMGMLRQRGRRRAPGWLSILQYLRLRLSLTNRKKALLVLPPRSRLLLRGAVATAISAFVFNVFYDQAVDLPLGSDGGAVAAIVSLLLVGPWFALAVSWFALPVDFQAENRGGWWIELGLVYLSALPLAILVAIPFAADLSESRFPLGVMVLVVVPFAAAAARLGTLVVADRVTGLLGELYEIVVGSAFGVLALSIGLAAVNRGAVEPDTEEALGYVWVLFLPALVAAAAAFAAIDRSYPPSRSVSPPLRIVAPATLAACLLLLAAVLVDFTSGRTQEPSVQIDGQKPSRQRVSDEYPVRVTPFSVTFDIPSRRRMRAAMKSEAGRDFILRVFTQEGIQVGYADDPPRLALDHPAGRYRLVADIFSGVQIEGGGRGEHVRVVSTLGPVPMPRVEVPQVPYLLAQRLSRNIGLGDAREAGTVAGDGEVAVLLLIRDLDQYQRAIAEQLRKSGDEKLLLDYLADSDSPGRSAPRPLSQAGLIECLDRVRNLGCSPNDDAWEVAAILTGPEADIPIDLTEISGQVLERGADYPLALLIQAETDQRPDRLEPLAKLPAFGSQVRWLVDQQLVECARADDLATCSATARGHSVADELPEVQLEQQVREASTP